MVKRKVESLRVLHVLKTSDGATWALRQIRELVKLGLEAHVALPGGGHMTGQYSRAGAVEHLIQTDFPVRRPWRFLSVSRDLSLLTEEIAPDIIHSHFTGTTATMRLSGRKTRMVPRVFQVPGPLHLEHALYRGADLMSAGPLDYWIASCRWTFDRYLLSGVNPRKVFLSYYGTDIDFYRRQKPGTLRSELGYGKDVRIIGMVAHMYPPKRYLGQRRGLKGHEDLIDAMNLCLQKRSDVRCVIIGGAWNKAYGYEEAIRKYAAYRCGDRVVFLGMRHDIPDLYADFDVAVHPSHSENVGGAVESCLLEVPTVASNVGGLPDLIQDGNTGWLVPPRDPKRLSQAILEVLEDPREAHSRAYAGMMKAREMFDVRKTAKEIRIIYDKILS